MLAFYDNVRKDEKRYHFCGCLQYLTRYCIGSCLINLNLLRNISDVYYMK